MIGVSYSPFCKYCMGVNTKPGESKVYCGLDDSWHIVTAGNCFGHCDKQEVIDGTEPAKWIEPTEDAESECCANCMKFDEEYLYCWQYGNHAPLNGKCDEYKPKDDA